VGKAEEKDAECSQATEDEVVDDHGRKEGEETEEEIEKTHEKVEAEIQADSESIDRGDDGASGSREQAG
jgi:hypothetical protein